MDYSLCFIEIPIFNASSVYPDLTPQNAASNQGLHCLPMPIKLDARLKWVSSFIYLRVLKFEQIPYTAAFCSHSVSIL